MGSVQKLTLCGHIGCELVIVSQPLLFKPTMLQFIVELDKTCMNVFCICVVEIALATTATEEYDVVEYVTIELATTLPCLYNMIMAYK